MPSNKGNQRPVFGGLLSHHTERLERLPLAAALGSGLWGGGCHSWAGGTSAGGRFRDHHRLLAQTLPPFEHYPFGAGSSSVGRLCIREGLLFFCRNVLILFFLCCNHLECDDECKMGQTPSFLARGRVGSSPPPPPCAFRLPEGRAELVCVFKGNLARNS